MNYKKYVEKALFVYLIYLFHTIILAWGGGDCLPVNSDIVWVRLCE